MKSFESARKNEKIVLVCEDDPQASQCIEVGLRALGYSTQYVREREQVVSFVRSSKAQISGLLLGVIMPDRGLIEILKELRAVDSQLPVIIVGGLWSVRDVVALLKNGATDFLSKPLVDADLTSVLIGALAGGNDPRKSDPSAHSGSLTERDEGSPRTFLSANRRIKEIESKVGKIGWSGVPVLIQGETGSGKEVLARSLHARSARSDKPFLKVNCAALPSELVESELFGYERGAFTGAFEKKPGIFELADGGTILLDEIGDMDIRLQAKLLQVLQDQEFRRIGGKETIKVDVRIIAATHRDLERAIHDRLFREDLYYRLSVIVLQVPPLRERSEDIIALGEFFLAKHSDPASPIPTIGLELKAAMMAYDWRGNVRELENFMRKLVIFHDSDAIARDLHARMDRKPPASARPAEAQLVKIDKREDLSILEQVTKDKQRAEIDAILAALESTRWNRKQAAVILKVDYKSLLYKMKKLGIDDSSPTLLEPHGPTLKRAANGD